MELLIPGLTLLVPVLVAIYTWNYGRWALGQHLYRGAAGLFVLAILTALVPGFVFLRNM